MSIEIVPFHEAETLLDWCDLTDALAAGHRLPKAQIGDTLFSRDADAMLNRSAWIDGLGLAVKTATVFPANAKAQKSTTNGGVFLYSDADGSLEAMLDFHLVTKWKTAGDSLLAARKLARPDTKTILIVGAGTVARSLRQAYGAIYPDAQFQVWSRTTARAEQLVTEFGGMQVARDLESAVRGADIVTVATMATKPLIKGEWLQPGQHIDLIGAYRPDMREADDLALQRGRLFVDSRDTTIQHIGELMIPIASGAIEKAAVQGDFYDLASGAFARTSDDEITIFKNGGGAHLDLMTSQYILQKWKNR